MIPALLLVICVVAFRVMTGVLIHSGAATWLSNFAPLAAITLCCAAYLPRRFKFALPLSMLFLSDVILNATYQEPLYHPQIVCRYLVLALVGLIGFALRKRASWKTMLPASLAASVIFYGITNIFAWLSDPGYVKNFAGLIQALTVGLPQYGTTPSWMFFRNSLLSDLTFTIVFVLLMRAQSPRTSAEVAVARAA
ncbi:MAG TPA: DUF6580 family putative transport protein [Chthoniobacterales bacterium]|jgi:hypothetical protein|nr:DUF6580 family putative transport protein [Chthoniobacterales bacterium]